MRSIRNINITVFLWALLLFINVIFLFLYGVDALEDRNNLQFFADSNTYHKIVSGEIILFDSSADLVSVAANFLGPWLILKFFSNNYLLVLLFNHLIFIYFIARISYALGLNSLKLLSLLILNPITLSSLISVNKEIISLLSLSFLMLFLIRRHWFDLLLAIMVSLLVRWQLMLFIIAAITIYPLMATTIRYRLIIFAGLLISISLAYLYASDGLSAVRSNFLFSADEHEGSGLWIKLNELQENGAYMVAFFFKSLHLLFGLSVNFFGIFSPENFYNDVIQVLNSVAFLVLLFINLSTQKIRLSNDIFFISLMYLLIFALTPIYSPRYLYPVYVLWVIMYCYKSSSICDNGSRNFKIINK